MIGIAFQVVCYLSILVIQVHVAYAQTSTINGRAEFAGTPVATNPFGPPTLVYNCAKLPAICQNVNRRNPLNNIAGGGLGELQGIDSIELNYDTDKLRHDGRNRGVCPGSWKRRHSCPETNAVSGINQPRTVPAGSSYGFGSYPAARFVQQNLVQGDAGFNKIADANGGDSGMIWTCDEWPPAMCVTLSMYSNSY